MTAKEFLIKKVPSLASEDIQNMHTFSGEFLLYFMYEYASLRCKKQLGIYRDGYNKVAAKWTTLLTQDKKQDVVYGRYVISEILADFSAIINAPEPD